MQLRPSDTKVAPAGKAFDRAWVISLRWQEMDFYEELRLKNDRNFLKPSERHIHLFAQKRKK